MELTIDQIEFLKAELDLAILLNCDEFEYPCCFSWPDISEEEIKDLEEKDLIGWYDGWNITIDGEKAYHANKHRLPYFKSIEERRKKIKDKNKSVPSF